MFSKLSGEYYNLGNEELVYIMKNSDLGISRCNDENIESFLLDYDLPSPHCRKIRQQICLSELIKNSSTLVGNKIISH